MLRQGCSLSMLHRTCEKVHGGVRLSELNMPNILCMPFILSQGWKGGLPSLPVRKVLMLTTRAPLVLSPPPMKLKPRVTLSYLTPRVYAKALKRSVVSMAYRPTSKVTAPLKTFWFPPRIQTPWKTKVGPSTASNVGTLHVMRNT